MAEKFEISDGNKEDKYNLLYRQAKMLAENEPDFIALLANLASMIHFTFGFFWTGFYRVCGSELVLGPFQGPLACSRIPYGKGVCGSAWKEEKTIIVENVDEFPGHIACSNESKSEIVVPFRINGRIAGVLDIDSNVLSTFDETDKKWLEKILTLIDL
ncbi:MAG: GAF domain-containing protein [Muribaculaceae bacterium]|nr:GAF domain-containing protein [Muribaculaceae bacterium]